jgi:carbonic anhydrase
MKKIITLLLILLSINTTAFASQIQNISADAALKKLKNGNKNFSQMHLHHPDVSKKRLYEIEKGQHPFAIIISCSDSRVPPEIIFDQGLGDLFEIRNAGNVFDDHVVGSVEYAIVHLGVKLVMVLGHQDCGAVKATIAHNHESKYIESLTNFIEPSVEKAKNQKGTLCDNAVKNNAIAVAKNLIESDSIIDDYVKHQNVKIVPAFYNMHTGLVELIEDKNGKQ